jgi:sugar phosphate isomerase/epimerase
MKFAICNETFVDWPFDKAFACARETGYTGVEIAPFTMATDVRNISAQRRQEVRAQAKAADLEVIGLHWLLAKTEGFYLTSPDEAVRKRTADYVCDLARLCRDLEGSLLVFGSPFQRNLPEGMPHEEGMKYAADVLRAAMPVCEELDVTIAVEPLGPQEGNFLRTAELGIELMNMVASTHCQLHLDCKAMSTESKPIPDIIRASRKEMIHFHANDPNKLGPGMGDLDFVPIFAALKEIGYDGWVSVEVFDYSPGAEFIARTSMENMLAALAKVEG